MEVPDLDHLGSSSSAVVANKREHFQLGKKEHTLDKRKEMVESKYRHSALDLIRRYEKLHKGQRSHYSMDADDELSSTESHESFHRPERDQRPCGLKEISMKESASLTPKKNKTEVRSKLFDYKKSQGRSRLRLIRDLDQDSNHGGSMVSVNGNLTRNRFPSVHAHAPSNGVSTLAGGSLRYLNRPKLAEEAQRRHSMGSHEAALPSLPRSSLTGHDYALHLLTSDQGKRSGSKDHDGRADKVSSAGHPSTSHNQGRTHMLQDLTEYSSQSSSSSNGSSDGLHRYHHNAKSMQNSSTKIGRPNGNQPQASVRKNMGKGAKSSQPQERKDAVVPNGRKSWVPKIPSHLAMSNPKLAGLNPDTVGSKANRHERRKPTNSGKSKKSHHVGLTEEALAEFQELLSDPTFCLRFDLIPDVSGPVCSNDQRTRRRMLALELLLKQLPSIKQELEASTFEPYEMLSCKYLRLSSNNVKNLVEMCREAGLNVDYHPHMESSDPKLQAIRPDESPDVPLAIPRQLAEEEDIKVSPGIHRGKRPIPKLRQGLPNAD